MSSSNRTTNASKRYMTESNDVRPVEGSKAVPKRKALGDITNAAMAIDNDTHETLKRTILPTVASATVTIPEVTEIDLDRDEEMVEDERFYMQRPCDDIDSRDARNPLLVTCYINEMYEHFHEQEQRFAVTPNYMESQTFINDRMRCILIDWLVEVHLKFKMVPETLYLTVNLIDRYLQQKVVRRSKLQLVGVSAMLAAAKYEEIYPPEIRDLVYITDRAYNKQEILEMESDIVNTLQWNFTVPTIHSFLCRYLKAAHADRSMVQLACYLSERCLQEYSMVKYLPSMIAAVSVCVARKSLRRHPWSPTLKKYTGYDEPEMSACIADMRLALENPSEAQQAVFRKYSSAKFGSVSRQTLSF